MITKQKQFLDLLRQHSNILEQIATQEERCVSAKRDFSKTIKDLTVATERSFKNPSKANREAETLANRKAWSALKARVLEEHKLETLLQTEKTILEQKRILTLDLGRLHDWISVSND